MWYRHAFIFLILLLISLGPGCSKKGDVVVAKVGDESLSVNDAVEIMSGGGYSDDLEGVKEALEHLVDFKLLLAGAKGEGLDTTVEFRKDLRVMEENFVVRKLYEEVVVQNAAATEEEVKGDFDEHGHGEDQVETRHILVSYREGEDEQRQQESMEKAEKVLEEALSGADFAELATKYSDGPTAPNGGYLGYFPRGRMVKPFEDAAFALQPGELSGIVQTQFGFHIIKVENKRSRTLEEMREEVRAYVEQPKREKLSREFLKDLESNAEINYVDEAIDSMINLMRSTESVEEAMVSSELVIATFDGGEWTAGKYLDFYNDFPADYINAPRDKDEVKAVLKGLIRNELLIQKAKEAGIESKPEFGKELAQLKDDALVQIFIKKKVYVESEISDEELTQYYEEHQDSYNKPFEEVEEIVRTDLVDAKRQKRLDELTVPLREQLQVVMLDENLSLVLDELKKKR
jgi:parvulin-like peptidyl-prolyl isomerase